MNKETIREIIKRITGDRSVMTLMIGLALTGFVYSLVTALNVHRGDVSVTYIRYTAFGEAHFYKDHWQYLFGFVLFGVVATVVHELLIVKLYNLGRRQTALLIGWLGIAILIIALLYTLAVLSLGRAS